MAGGLEADAIARLAALLNEQLQGKLPSACKISQACPGLPGSALRSFRSILGRPAAKARRYTRTPGVFDADLETAWSPLDLRVTLRGAREPHSRAEEAT